MKTSIKNIQISLSPYWAVFSKYKQESITPTTWQGPAEPEQPPFDIMCPTPPRAAEEEERLTELIKDLVRTTDLGVAEIRLAVSDNIGTEIEDVLVSNKAAELVLEKTATSAVVKDFANVNVELEGKNAKILVVNYNSNMKTEDDNSSSDKKLWVSIKEENNHFIVTSTNMEAVFDAKSLVQVTNQVGIYLEIATLGPILEFQLS